jgi:STE24 endopeptidase
MAWLPNRASLAGGVELRFDAAGVVLFLGFYVILVITMALWSRLLARRVSGRNLQRSMNRFNWMMQAARYMVPAWFAVGLFALGWGDVVSLALWPLRRVPVELPALLLASLPAIGAWMALWWSNFPADRALREQAMLIQLDANLPVHAPPSFRSYFTANVRLQLLFTLVPVLLILLARDVLALALWLTGRAPTDAAALEGIVMLGATAAVFLLAPEILRRVLHTQPLPDDALRARLEALCRQHRLRYRDILLWRTDHNMGNAAVMGMIPQLRYILLSDLLLETMTDEQIEAVFAHELGHIVHRHMAWYVVFFMILAAVAAGPGELIHQQLERFSLFPGDRELVMLSLGVAGFLLAFGFLSRRFERQADVFAARTIEPRGADAPGRSVPPVGERGAKVFASALHRVAVINNIPIAARSWCHGSIAKRMDYLSHLSADPSRTGEFDRFMLRLYIGLLIVLAASSAVVVYLSGLTPIL